MTVLQLITSSLRLIGQLGPGRSAGASELADALLVLNSMLDQWNTERLTVFRIVRAVYHLAGTPSHTLSVQGRAARIETAFLNDDAGSAATGARHFGVVLTRDGSGHYPLPAGVSNAVIYQNGLRMTGDIDYTLVSNVVTPVESWEADAIVTADYDLWTSPLSLATGEGLAEGTPLRVLTYEQWAAGWSGVYLDPAYPTAVVYLRPAPAAGLLDLAMWQPLAQFANVNETVEFPPGYQDAIRYNLAMRLAPEWGRAPRADVIAGAREFKAAIAGFNAPSPLMAVDPAISDSCGYNVLTDQ